MASHLIGVPVTVTLKHPPNGLVQGLVAHIDGETFTLSLRNVFFPATGQRYSEYTISGPQILDIAVIQASAPENIPPSSSLNPPQAQQAQPDYPPNRPVTNPYPVPLSIPPQLPPQPLQHGTSMQSPLTASRRNSPPSAQPGTIHAQAQVQRKSFVDPAILSVGRKPSVATVVEIPASVPTPRLPQEAPSTPAKPLAQATKAPRPISTSAFVGGPKKAGVDSLTEGIQNISATLSEPFTGLQIKPEVIGGDDSDEALGPEDSLRRLSLTKTRTGKPMETSPKPADGAKKTRRGKSKKNNNTPGQSRQAQAAVESPPERAKKVHTPAGFKAKGWRQTPLLEAASGDSPRTPGIISGRVGLAAVNASNRKIKKQRTIEAKNGWATEDATDIQELPDFDFVGNLSKFDKRAVFEQIRNEDTTADEDRLVTFNRVARPGTYGGKNLHPTENVLDNPKSRVHSNSFSSTETDEDFDSGRNSRRAMSRASLKRAPHRTGSGIQAEDLNSHAAANALLTRSKGSYSRPSYASSSHMSGSPKPSARQSPPDSPGLLSTSNQTAARPASLRVNSTNRTCHCITPMGMAAVEEIAELDFGITEDIMAENAGRGIAEVALSSINPDGRRLARDNLAINAKPVVVVLVGNHRSGARAVAAARHLHLRGLRVMVAVLGYERDSGDWDKDMRRQVQLLKKFGGLVRSWADIEEVLKKLEAPPELILDALLGRNREFEALGDIDKKEALRVIGWANKSRAGVLAIEGPSGVAGSTGEVSILEGEPLEVRAKHIVCLGAPRSGLLRALQNGVGRSEPVWTIWVVDLGLNRPWRKSGVAAVGAPNTSGRSYGVSFGSDWVVQARFVDSEEAERGR